MWDKTTFTCQALLLSQNFILGYFTSLSIIHPLEIFSEDLLVGNYLNVYITENVFHSL